MSNDSNQENLNKRMFIMIATVSVLLPFIIFGIVYYINTNEVIPISFDKKDVLAYYGSIIGACFTGFITAGGLYFTLYQNSKTINKQIQENKNLFDDQIEENKKSKEEDKYSSVMPMLKINKKTQNIVDECLYYKEQARFGETVKSFELMISNIGIGPAMRVQIKMNDTYLLTSRSNTYQFDLGVGEIFTMKVSMKNDCKFDYFDEDNTCVNFVLECCDIYKKKEYKYFLKAIINNYSKDIELFSYESMEVYELNS